MTTTRKIALWLLVAFVGIQFGAGWYEKLVVVPQWADAPPDQVLATMEGSGMKAAGRVFWPFVSPVVALLALVNLVLAWRSGPTPNRKWWFAGAAVMVGYAITSYAYFVPQILRFQSGGADWTPDDVQSFVDWWTSLNYGRMAVGGIGWLLLLRALSLSESRSGSRSESSSATGADLGPAPTRR